MNPLQEFRDKAGRSLYKSGSVKENNKDSFLVISATVINTEYKVDIVEGHGYCSCPDYEKRKSLICKHIKAVELYIQEKHF